MYKTLSFFIFSLGFLCFSCSGKSYQGFPSKADYENALEKFDYYQFRTYKLWDGIDRNDFSYLNEETKDGRLVGNELDEDFMADVRTSIFIKNNLPFENEKITQEYQNQYKYYDPTKPKKLSDSDEKVLDQIAHLLTPNKDDVDFSRLAKELNGTWQVKTFQVYDGYLYSLRFKGNKFALVHNEMAMSDRFRAVRGTFAIENRNLVLYPETLEQIVGGQYFDANKEGLIQEFIGGKSTKEHFDETMKIVYPVLKFEWVDNHGFRLQIFTDRPTYFYRVSKGFE